MGLYAETDTANSADLYRALLRFYVFFSESNTGWQLVPLAADEHSRLQDLDQGNSFAAAISAS